MKNQLLNISQYILIGGLTITMGIMAFVFRSSKEESKKVLMTEQFRNDTLRKHISSNNSIHWSNISNLNHTIDSLKNVIDSLNNTKSKVNYIDNTNMNLITGKDADIFLGNVSIKRMKIPSLDGTLYKVIRIIERPFGKSQFLYTLVMELDK